MQTPIYNRMLASFMAQLRLAPPYIAGFDSGTAMLRATAAYLRGEDFPGMGTLPPAIEPIATVLNQLPRQAKELIYTVSSAGESIPPERLGDVSSEVVSEWMVNEYPQNEYQAVAIGSASGALVHLCAALGMPWLPQTFLIPVLYPELHPDEPKKAMEWGRQKAQPLLDANPDLQLHHMYDPSQDRLTLRGMTYFRVKYLRLSSAYKRFLEKNLPRGGTIFLVECERTWPTTRIGDRHFFQFGALGGATPEEYHNGSERVTHYLEKYQSHRRHWDAPTPDGETPEAEWGFEASLRQDVENFARDRGYHIRRIIFKQPEHLSPFVAEFYRWWYKQRGIIANRLLVESFILLEPMWTLRTGSVPFWMKFNMEPSLNWIKDYLGKADIYDEIFMILFSHGVESVGLPTIAQWREVFKYARQRGEFIGMVEADFPRNFATLIRYYTDLKRTISARYPVPGSLSLERLDQFIAETGDRFPVQWQ
ncbi:hypothetical protein [Nodularia sphaerocarpa]|uniref:hypothetical protein n=1 Tax=Nodularia sphaerocarpa TaxID=137816 RepID=UPI001EFB9290|nr:hypothetical protein [Nodularia sphaerocarpa]MDB9373534.1 hypothetical protein [Nodularia sphaerocarpa CS-585]MDB9377666.1 hypothetical protein [Nodularia sphaerocarpa CS-585A2]ULP70627.1 hypothetical protein BDGGKGIB_00243 [Nodularia sphaerocarpa UHCC 0038]